MFNKKMKRSLISAAIANCLLLSPVYAADWLSLQGTEPDSTAGRMKMWGYIQAQYQKDMSDPNAGDAYIPPKLIGPNLNSQEQFNVNRAAIGARGTGFPLDAKVNYFILAEFGNSGVTAPNGGSAHVTDASITLNQIPGARIRVGLFKTPGSEESFKGIGVFDYINFTEVTNQLLVERFPNARDAVDAPPTTLPSNSSLNAFDNPVGAVRDVGVQVFDTFKKNDWEHSYAVMLGNGNGLNFGDNDDNKETYLYWASEKVFSGAGPRRDGLKMFVWTQSGKRQLDTSVDSVYNPVEYDRKRSGFGVKYLKNAWRIGGEFMQGEGMIFVGPDKPSFDISAAAPGGNGEEGKANGYYLDVGYRFPGTKWELDARYDVYNRLTDDTPFPGGPNIGKTFEMQFTTLTLGAQYHFNKKSRVTINYADRTAEAVDWAANAGPNANLDGVGNRLSVQVTHLF